MLEAVGRCRLERTERRIADADRVPSEAISGYHHPRCKQTYRSPPECTDLQSILILGSGPIVIGQVAEFGYSGTQAVHALCEEGYSNPATITTDLNPKPTPPNALACSFLQHVRPEIGASHPRRSQKVLNPCNRLPAVSR
jgi:hypothetical protein